MVGKIKAECLIQAALTFYLLCCFMSKERERKKSTIKARWKRQEQDLLALLALCWSKQIEFHPEGGCQVCASCCTLGLFFCFVTTTTGNTLLRWSVDGAAPQLAEEPQQQQQQQRGEKNALAAHQEFILPPSPTPYHTPRSVMCSQNTSKPYKNVHSLLRLNFTSF